MKCDPVTKDGKYTTFGEVYEKLIEVINQYNDCAKKHNSLVDFEQGK